MAKFANKKPQPSRLRFLLPSLRQVRNCGAFCRVVFRVARAGAEGVFCDCGGTDDLWWKARHLNHVCIEPGYFAFISQFVVPRLRCVSYPTPEGIGLPASKSVA